MALPAGFILDVARAANREPLTKGAPRGEFLIRCPSSSRHRNGDQNPSCRLNPEKNTFFCDPCGRGGGITKLARSLGVDVKKLRVESLAVAKGATGGGPTSRRIAGTYPYHDEQGQCLFEVVRFDPKGFSQRRPNENRWIWGLRAGWYRQSRSGDWRSIGCAADPDTQPEVGARWFNDSRRTLYRFPDLLEAIKASKLIFIVEGEKDVDRLNEEATERGLNVFATCNPGGAGKWRDEYSEVLRGAAVVIVADKDDAGRRHARKVFKSLTGIATSARIVEAASGKDLSDHFDAGRSVDELEPVDNPAKPGAETDEEDEADTTSASSPKASRATRLVEIATAEAVLFHTPDGTGYADIVVREHRETWPLRSRAFRGWLDRRYYEIEGKAAGAQAFSDAVGVLEGIAQFDGAELPVYVRVAAVDDILYLDLANESWESIEVSPSGWRVISAAPVRFRRARGMTPLPLPVPGGSVEALRPFLNVADDDDFKLSVAWLVGSFRSQGPYPIAVLQGEQGAGKSTRARVLRTLLDPSTVALRRPPKNEHDLVIAANNSFLVAYDNVSRLHEWLSDSLCCLATGGGFGTRKLYTDVDEELFEATRPIIINGIADLVVRPDLTDRAIVFHLPPFEVRRRRPEAEFWREFDAVRPRILGALLDAVCAAVRRVDRVRLDRPPRLADFATFVVAAEEALPWASGGFLKAYSGNRSEAIELGLESDLLAVALRSLLATQSEWEGTATELHEALARHVAETHQRSRSWPKSPRSISDQLRSLAPPLRKVGINVEFGLRQPRTGRRLIVISTGEREAENSSVTTVASVPTVIAPSPAGSDGDAAWPAGDAGVTQADPRKPAPGLDCDEVDDGDDRSLLEEIADRETENGMASAKTNPSSARREAKIGDSCVTTVTTVKGIYLQGDTPYAGGDGGVTQPGSSEAGAGAGAITSSRPNPPSLTVAAPDRRQPGPAQDASPDDLEVLDL